MTVHDPVCTDLGNRETLHDSFVDVFTDTSNSVSNALYGSFLPIPSDDLFPPRTKQITPTELPGAVVCLKDPIKINTGRRRWKVKVANEGDRPIQVRDRRILLQWGNLTLFLRRQVGSHFPFLETNGSLSFNRLLAFHHKLRLDIPAGTAVRFEPGERKTVTLVQTGGEQLVSGGSGIGVAAIGQTPEEGEKTVRKLLQDGGFAISGEGEEREDMVDTEMDREVVSTLLKSGSWAEYLVNIVCIDVRTDYWRPRPPRRHKPLDPGRERLHRLWR